MANWRRLEAMADRIAGRAFGEPVRVACMKDGVPDPERPGVTVTATLQVEGDADAPLSGGRLAGGHLGGKVAAGAARLILMRTLYDGPKLRQGDKVQALERAGAPWFEVATVSDRHSNLVIITLTQA